MLGRESIKNCPFAFYSKVEGIWDEDFQRLVHKNGLSELNLKI